MAHSNEKPGAELFRGVMLAHLILGLHLALVALIGLVVIFFGGIARYWAWILLGGLVLVGGSGYVFYRRLKAQGRNALRDLKGVSMPAGGSLEVSFMGGLASVKFARPGPPGADALPPPASVPLLEDAGTQRVRELTSLAQMYERQLITREEFDRAKAALFTPPHRPEFAGRRFEN
jgi:hypothetical protein